MRAPPLEAGGRKGEWLRRRHLGRVGRGHRKIYLFEVLILLQLAVFHVLLHSEGLGLRPAALKHTIAVTGKLLVPLFLLGCILRLLFAALKGRGRAYLRRVLRWSWIFLSARLLLAGTLVIHVYGWLKGLLQLLRPTLYDELLWEIDRWIFFGFSPNVFSLYAFRHPVALAFMDATYGDLFFYALVGSIPFFFSLSSDRLRLAYATGCSTLWLFGAWLYFLVPSMGPCYVFPEVWAPFVAHLGDNLRTQSYLFDNYQLVKLIPQGILHPDFNLMAGIAAFPSLHVASQIFIALWVHRLVRWLRLVFHLSVVVVFVGSVVTGWHYLVDSIAGLVLGWACFRFGFDLYGLRRWHPRAAGRENSPARAQGAKRVRPG